jgi:hypothetical protein
MRFVVLLFGLIATLVTAALGTAFFMDSTALTWLHDQKIDQLDILFNSVDPNLARTGLFLFIAAGYCFLGTLLAFFRCGWQGGLLMIVTVVGPAVLNPITLLGTGPQIFTAILSCFVRPLPIVPVPQED